MSTHYRFEDLKRNTFSEKSGDYAHARPQYPEALYAWLATQCPDTNTAWDCATGNGQAAVGLSRFFNSVIATDVSPEQIKHCMRRENIIYKVLSAENSGLDSRSVDLVAVAQALHWFDYARFWPEVRRIARPGALFCAWGYAWLSSVQEVNDVLISPFRNTIAPFWAANNRLLWNGYQARDVLFPFAPINTPDFEISLEWSIQQLVDYMKTWSAYKLSMKDKKVAADLDKITYTAISTIPSHHTIPVTMPLSVIAGVIDG